MTIRNLFLLSGLMAIAILLGCGRKRVSPPSLNLNQPQWTYDSMDRHVDRWVRSGTIYE